MARWRTPRPDLRSPLTWILVAVGVLHVVALGWGLPASDGWDNDGVAPRDFLPGLAATFTPGRFNTYPPVHLAILTLLTLPITCVALLRAPSLAVTDVVGEIIKVPYMTAMAYVARGVSAVLSVAIVLFIARIAEEIRAHELGLTPARMRQDARVRSVGYSVAAFVGVNASLTYYAQTSNLDVPYLFWATWSVLVFTRAMARREPRLLRRAFALAVLAIGTKDQAYGLFLLSVPIALGLWIARDARGDRVSRRAVLRELVVAALSAAVLLAVVDGVIVNPSGFKARLAFLTGRASQDYSEYTNDWSGRWQVLVESARRFHLQYPLLLVAALPLGLVRAVRGALSTERERRPAQWAIALLPLLAALSFTVTFNWSARRTDARFLLPQSIMLGVYGGLAVDWLVFAANRARRVIGQAVASVALAASLFACLSVNANMILDPRYDAEAWLAAHVRPGDTIETYGLNVYMPRMPSIARILRVGPEPVDKRNPMPGVVEVQAPYEQAPQRGARFIVLNGAWAWRYLVNKEQRREPGAQMAPTLSRSVDDEATVRFFEQLLRSAGAFGIVHEAKYDDRVFPVIDVHGTTGRSIWIYERKPTN